MFAPPLARAHAVASAVALALVFSVAPLAAQEPEIPPGWVQVDDLILPSDVVFGDSTYSATPWTGGVVPYIFDANVSAADQLVGIDAMAEWAAVANLTFVPRTTQANYIRFYTTNSNSSFVGMIGGQQTINIFNWNYRFIVCHEICHALGYWHEQSRPDRNTYVTINYANIDPNYSYNFNIVSGATMNGTYDFDSVMHYGATAFTINGQPTITINPGYSGTIGQRQHLSVLDAQGAATQYGAAPPPTIATLSPTTVPAGNPTFTLTVNGTRFCRGTNDGNGVAGTVVEWNGIALATTYVNPTQLLATVPGSFVAAGGVANVTVYNAAPGGGVSTSVPFTIGTPPPSLTSIAPVSASVGGATFTLTATGAAFQPTSVVRFAGTDLPTTYVNGTSLQATVAASFIALGGTYPITVHTPGPNGGTTSAVNFSAINPAPILFSITPNSGLAGNGPFTLTANGASFNAQSKVRWNGVDLPTVLVSASQLTATVSALQSATIGGTAVTVQNPGPGGGTSLGLTYTGSNGVPTLTTLSPAAAPQNGAAFTLTLNGAGFNAASIVKWNNVNRTTTFVSGTQITAAIPASDLSAAGTANVRVTNNGVGGGNSATLNFTITVPAPSLTSISPTAVAAGAATFTLTANGANFQAGSLVRFNGADLATTYGSASQLTATVPAALVAAAGTASIEVFNPNGGWTSAAQTLTVNPGAPVLASIAPSSTVLGSGATTVVLTGSSFAPASVVRRNGVDLATTYLSSTSLSAVIAAPDTASVGTATLTVFTPAPGGGTSAAQTFTVGYPVPTLGSFSPAQANVGGPQTILTVFGSGFYSGVTTVRWNGAPLATTYVNATTLTAIVPAANLTTNQAASITLFNAAPLGGVSTAGTFNVNNPAPVLILIGPPQVTAGDVAFTLNAVVFGANASSVIRIDGVPLATTFSPVSNLAALVPASMIASPGTRAVTIFNPGPGGGTSAAATLTVSPPQISSLSTATTAPLAANAPPLALTLTGQRFLPSSLVWGNGIALPTTYAGATSLLVSVPASTPGVGTPGGVALTVQNGGTALSNTVALNVGGVGNLGTVITDPPSSTPNYGGVFAMHFEGGAPNQPFTLLLDAASTPTITGFPTPAANFALETSSPILAPIFDGLGLFGAPGPYAFGPATGATPPGGAFTVSGLPSPSGPSGSSYALQVIYFDPTSPVAWRLGYAADPRSY
jgi:hypothetical protein